MTLARPQPIPASAPPARPLDRVPYLPALDGLRALAVIAVVLYHADVAWTGGGFLGVDVFFVISGYLITLLLMAEHRRTGRIGLRDFWVRRARRLLPALYTLLFVVTAVCVLWARQELGTLRAQLLAALTYCTNWYLIATGSSYFDNLGHPPILKHLWSLAVEEQFYLVWPLVILVLLKVCRGRLALLAGVMAGMVLASTVWMAVLYQASDPSRAYYGTDTRAGALVLGALLALVWRPGHVARGPVMARGRSVDLAALAGLAVVGMAVVWASDTGPFLYYGGFLVIGLATLPVIAAAAHPACRTATILGAAPLRWIGVRSYGIYLWHWPVFVLTEPGEYVDWGPTGTFVMRIAITMALAEAGYRWVERPVRDGVVRRWVASLREATPEARLRRLHLTRCVAVFTVLVAGPLVVAVSTAQPSSSGVVASLQAGQLVLSNQGTPAPTAPTATTAPAATTAVAPRGGTPNTIVLTPVTEPGTPSTSAAAASTSTAASTTAAPTAVAPTAAPATPVVGRAVAIGDSVMLGAAPQLKEVLGAGSYVDAVVGRQFDAAVGIVRTLRDTGRLGDVVVIHLGNNGTVGADDLDKLLTELRSVRRVVLVNVRVPRKWQDSVNATLAGHAGKFANVRLVDWYDASAGHLGDFYSDGIHLKPPAAQLYASLIRAATA